MSEGIAQPIGSVQEVGEYTRPVYEWVTYNNDGSVSYGPKIGDSYYRGGQWTTPTNEPESVGMSALDGVGGPSAVYDPVAYASTQSVLADIAVGLGVGTGVAAVVTAMALLGDDGGTNAAPVAPGDPPVPDKPKIVNPDIIPPEVPPSPSVSDKQLDSIYQIIAYGMPSSRRVTQRNKKKKKSTNNRLNPPVSLAQQR